jgi:large-conductance mechanosensitive channel
VERLRPFLTLRDVPLWLAAAGLAFLASTGLVQAVVDPTLVPVVVIVVGGALVATVGGRFVVRRFAYNRLLRIVVALVALAMVFFLPGALAFVMLPSALALLAVEMMAPPPAPGAEPAWPARWSIRPSSLPRGAPPAGGQETGEPTGFDWPEEPAPTRRRR